jgi:hypothetical protein
MVSFWPSTKSEWYYLIYVATTSFNAFRSRSTSYFTTDVCVGHPFGVHDLLLLFPSFCRTIALPFVLGCPLWREDGSVNCSTICQWSESRRIHNHTLLSHLRLLGSLSVASCDSQGLRWKYSYPPPHGDNAFHFINIRSYCGRRTAQKKNRSIMS